MKTKNLLSHPLWVIALVFFIASCGKDEIDLDDGYEYDGEQVTDVDGNVYNTITIGTQTWLAENLRTTTYNDGTAIPNITNSDEWIADTSGAYCNYNNDEDYVEDYGRLYNVYVVNTNNLCPTGWHVPSNSEWETLIEYIDADSIYGSDSVGLVLKSTKGWSNDGNGTDDYHFRALPAGSRSGYDGDFADLSNYGYWWCSEKVVESTITSIDTVTVDSAEVVVYDTTYSRLGDYYLLNYFDEDISDEMTYDASLGLSVRCIKDSE